MGITGQIFQLLEFPKDGHVDIGPKSLFKLSDGRHLAFPQQLGQVFGMKYFGPHNVSIPP